MWIHSIYIIIMVVHIHVLNTVHIIYSINIIFHGEA